MLKTYQRKTKLFKFSQDTNKGKIKKKEQICFANASLWGGATSLCIVNIALREALYQYYINNICIFCLFSSHFSMFSHKDNIFLDDDFYRKILVCCQGPPSQWRCSRTCTNFFIMASINHLEDKKWKYWFLEPMFLRQYYIFYVGRIQEMSAFHT